jgi:hypothetical protein
LKKKAEQNLRQDKKQLIGGISRSSLPVSAAKQFSVPFS